MPIGIKPPRLQMPRHTQAQKYMSVSGQRNQVRNSPRAYPPMSRLLCEEPDSVPLLCCPAALSLADPVLSDESTRFIALYR